MLIIAAKPGQSFIIQPIVYDQTGAVIVGATVTYQSLSPLVATVNSAGLVSCLTVGSAVINSVCGSVTTPLTVNVANATPTSMQVTATAPQ